MRKLIAFITMLALIALCSCTINVNVPETSAPASETPADGTTAAPSSTQTDDATPTGTLPSGQPGTQTPAPTASEDMPYGYEADIHTGEMTGFADNFTFGLKAGDGVTDYFNVYDEHLANLIAFLEGYDIMIERDPDSGLVIAASPCTFLEECDIATFDGFEDNHTVQFTFDDGSFKSYQIRDEKVKEKLYDMDGTRMVYQIDDEGMISEVYLPNF